MREKLLRVLIIVANNRQSWDAQPDMTQEVCRKADHVDHVPVILPKERSLSLQPFPTTPLSTPVMTTPSSRQSTTLRILSNAHTVPEASQIYAEKVQNKPLLLTPTAKTEGELKVARDAREIRRRKREDEARRKRRKPKPLSAKEKRKLCIYDIPKEERKFEIYRGLHGLWCDYMREILGISKIDADAAEEAIQKHRQELARLHVTPAMAGPRLASADFHGAHVSVVRSSCVSRVGVRGIVVRDTKFTFVVITKANEIKTLPKEGSVFRFEVPSVGAALPGEQPVRGDALGIVVGDQLKTLVFELQGDQFQVRAAERATKKFKMHIPDDL